MKKNICEGCGEDTWPGYDLCPDCELKLKERRAEERIVSEFDRYMGGSVTPNKGRMK